MPDIDADPLGDTDDDDARLEAEKELIADTDNSARPEDGDQPEWDGGA